MRNLVTFISYAQEASNRQTFTDEEIQKVALGIIDRI
jgi:hypothetical protein